MQSSLAPFFASLLFLFRRVSSAGSLPLPSLPSLLNRSFHIVENFSTSPAHCDDLRASSAFSRGNEAELFSVSCNGRPAPLLLKRLNTKSHLNRELKVSAKLSHGHCTNVLSGRALVEASPSVRLNGSKSDVSFSDRAVLLELFEGGVPFRDFVFTEIADANAVGGQLGSALGCLLDAEVFHDDLVPRGAENFVVRHRNNVTTAAIVDLNRWRDLRDATDQFYLPLEDLYSLLPAWLIRLRKEVWCRAQNSVAVARTLHTSFLQAFLTSDFGKLHTATLQPLLKEQFSMADDDHMCKGDVEL